MALDLLSVAKLVDITAVSTALAKNGTVVDGGVWPTTTLICHKAANKVVNRKAITRHRKRLVQNSLE